MASPLLQSALRQNDPSGPSDDAIEAIIHHATSINRPLNDQRPLRDTRTQLFVGNLPYRVRWQDLKDLFRKAGTVLRADVSLGPDNRSRGHGTVLLATAEDAGRAVDMFHGYNWQTRVLDVRHDRLMPEYEQGNCMNFAGGVSGTGVAPGSGPHSLIVGGSVGGAHPGIQGSGLGAMLAALSSTSGSSTTMLGPDFGSGNTLGNNTTDIGRPVSSSTSSNAPFNFGFPFSVPASSSRPSSSSAVAIRSDQPAQNAGANYQYQTPDLTANRTLFVGNLPFHIQWQDLKDLFRQAGGPVLRADVALGPDNRSRGFGAVVFANEADAERAVRMFNGYDFAGRVLKVQFDKFSSLLTQQPSSTSSSTSSLPISSFSPAGSSQIPLTSASSQHQQHREAVPLHIPPSATLSASPLPIRSITTRSSLPHLQSHSSTSHADTYAMSSAPVSSFPGTDVESGHIRHLAQQDHHPNSSHLTLPPGFMYDYGPHSGPESPHEITYQLQQDRQERDYFEKIYGTTEQHPSEVMQLHVQKQQHQKEDENDVRWEWERLRLQQQQHHHQREWERGRGRDWDWERDRNKQRDQRFVSLPPPPPPPPATSSVEPAFDVNSLTSSLATMSARLAPSSASASTSASHSNSNSNPHSNIPSKPPSTQPMGMGMSVSTTSLPPGLGSGLPAVGNNLEKYDRQYPHQQMHLPSVDTRISSDSEPLMSKMATNEVDSVLTDSSSSSPILSAAQTHARAQGIYPSSSSMSAESDMSSGASSGYGSGRVSRSSQEWDGCSVGGSGAEEKEAGKVVTLEDTWERQGQEYDSSSTSQEQAQIQRTKQVPYHPGPISIPPMTFNPMQMPMGMIMPLTTMTPGHAHMAHAMMGMMNPNMSPLYHPAAVAAAAMGGGPSSPYRMYPTAPGLGSPSAVLGTGVITLTPHGLPPITPSMPPFNFLPPLHLHQQQQQQQYFSDGKAAEGQGRGGGNGKSEGGRPSTSRVEGGCGACNSSSSVQVSTSGQPPSQEQLQQQQQQQRAYPLRLNLATAAGGFSPAMTMSPGTFYGRPGEVPGPNPYINAAVGAPVHPVSHPAMYSPPVHPHPHHPHHPHHPSSLYRGHGTPQGVYYYAAAMASPSKAPMTGMEPQGYFDPMYFPANRTEFGDGGEGSAVSGGGGDSFETEDGEEVKEVASPLPEGPGDPSSPSGDEGEDDPEHGEKSEADGVPSRTRSVGHSRDPSCLPGGEKLTTHGHGRGVVHRSGSDPGKP